MAQPNMVREPSMDEILASIRRIIESNEPVTQAGVATALASPEGFSGRPANDDAEEVTLTVDEAFAEQQRDFVPPPVLRAVADAQAHAHAAPPVEHDLRQPPMAQSAPQKPLSLADVAARVRAASERTSAAIRDLAANQHAEPAQSVATPHEVHAPAAAVEPEHVELAIESLPFEKVQSFVDETHVSPAAPAHVDHNVSYHAEAESRPEPLSLLSSSTGEQVARSFSDLAMALDNAERRSLDEIAEDMLRPMLQEWLDDNLPTLVERLVREEIERVARGPRR